MSDRAWLVATVAIPIDVWTDDGRLSYDEAVAHMASYYECGTWCAGNLPDMLARHVPDADADLNVGPCGCEIVTAVTVLHERPTPTRCRGGQTAAEREVHPDA